MNVDTPGAAKAFEAPKSRRIILALAAEELTLGGLASKTGLSLSLLHYHVGRLMKFGLLEVAGEDRRAGRPAKRYRAVARQFFVPATLASGASNEALMRELKSALERDRTQRSDTGVLYRIDETGQPRMNRPLGEGDPRSLEIWMMMTLTAQDTRKLREELRSIFERYRGSDKPGSAPMIAYCAVAART